MKKKLGGDIVKGYHIACIALALLLTSCKMNADPPIVSCKFGNSVVSVPRKDLIFYHCDDEPKEYNILNIVQNSNYRIEIRSYKDKILPDWHKPLYGSSSEDIIDNQRVFCTLSNVPYHCGVMVSNYKIPFYIEWKNFDGVTKSEARRDILEAKSYLDRNLRNADDSTANASISK